MDLKRSASGSITVEAAFIVPLVLFLVFSLLAEGIYLHDRLVVKALLDGYLLKLSYIVSEPVHEDGSLNLGTSDEFFSKKDESNLKNISIVKQKLFTEASSATILARNISVHIEKEPKSFVGMVSFQLPYLQSLYLSSYFREAFTVQILSQMKIHPDKKELLRILYGLKGTINGH